MAGRISRAVLLIDVALLAVVVAAQREVWPVELFLQRRKQVAGGDSAPDKMGRRRLRMIRRCSSSWPAFTAQKRTQARNSTHHGHPTHSLSFRGCAKEGEPRLPFFWFLQITVDNRRSILAHRFFSSTSPREFFNSPACYRQRHRDAAVEHPRVAVKARWFCPADPTRLFLGDLVSPLCARAKN